MKRALPFDPINFNMLKPGWWALVAPQECLELIGEGLGQQAAPIVVSLAKAISLAGQVFRIDDIWRWHGGDVVYKLAGIDGVWRQAYLRDALSYLSGWGGPLANAHYRIHVECEGQFPYVAIDDIHGTLCRKAKEFPGRSVVYRDSVSDLGVSFEHDGAIGADACVNSLSCWSFERRFQFVGTYDYGEFANVCDVTHWFLNCAFVVAKAENVGGAYLELTSSDNRQLRFADILDFEPDELPIGLEIEWVLRIRENRYLLAESQLTQRGRVVSILASDCSLARCVRRNGTLAVLECGQAIPLP